jgi:ATP-dependent protease HslVU (ClpYQ) ATPase subunit
MSGFKTAVAGAALAFASLAGFAQTATDPAATPGVDQRQARQERRIDQGVASGELTQREARRLGREQNIVDKAENKAKADGTVTVAERKRLHRMQNRSSRDISRQKHDAQQAPGKN